MKIGISSLIFTQMKRDVDIAPFLKAASDKGFRYIEYSDNNSPSLNEAKSGKFKNVKSIAEDYGIKIISVHIPPENDIPELNNNLRANALQNAKLNLFNAAELGAQYAVLHLPFVGDKSEQELEVIQKTFYESLPELLEEAQKLQITILLENTIGPWCGNIEIVNNIIRSYGNSIGFCLDIGHSIIEKYNPINAILENADTLKYLHVHDNKGKKDLHLIPGEGIASWERIFDALLDSRFDGIFMFECIATLALDKPPETLEMVKNYLGANIEKRPELFKERR
jgi:sugar phosphate isomerase/epimerase